MTLKKYKDKFTKLFKQMEKEHGHVDGLYVTSKIEENTNEETGKIRKKEVISVGISVDFEN